ncbi:hypothetical protein IQ279_23900 [Streptomyces verrucosisporus]|uniref:hypothetical protein n=1 Tax=Streptomyces verrucosisporus TaxID=1695161 RepID=UPI0019D1FF50|nr:hypothetical protein [Streptomyces verrucosisporus]MBN3932621.1 hypothetical protein [Streptomyces verrucosisporus]
MTSPEPPSPGSLREDLSRLLQEGDPHRPLDSLEVVVVRGFLTQRLPRLDTPAPGDVPKTIEGWVTWAERHSAAS